MNIRFEKKNNKNKIDDHRLELEKIFINLLLTYVDDI